MRMPAEARIDHAALRANYATVTQLAAGRAVIAVVKADAYGHGMRDVALTLAEAGCRHFAVATLEEGRVLRAVLSSPEVAAKILVFGSLGSEADVAAAIDARLTVTVHDVAGLERASKVACSRGETVPIQLEIDTGMRRMGVPPERALELVLRAAGEPGLVLAGVFTHLARADEVDLAPSIEQVAWFRGLLADVRSMDVDPGQIHFANSSGVLAGQALLGALPEATAVRPGLMLYGANPAPHFDVPLASVMTLSTEVACVRDAQAGDGIGYGATYRAERATRIATLPIGYADGVPIAMSNRGRVALRGKAFPIVGRVSMDSMTIDVGDEPVGVGEPVVLFGHRPDAGSVAVEAAAAAAQTLSYELLVRVGTRVPRVHRDGRGGVSR